MRASSCTNCEEDRLDSGFWEAGYYALDNCTGPDLSIEDNKYESVTVTYVFWPFCRLVQLFPAKLSIQRYVVSEKLVSTIDVFTGD